jgi:hypothetical protein
MVKYATALRLGTAQTEAILRRLTRNNVQHPKYKALAELGRAVKTIFLCRYLHSEAYVFEAAAVAQIPPRDRVSRGSVYGKSSAMICSTRRASASLPSSWYAPTHRTRTSAAVSALSAATRLFPRSSPTAAMPWHSPVFPVSYTGGVSRHGSAQKPRPFRIASSRSQMSCTFFCALRSIVGSYRAFHAQLLKVK